ncbi:restriction endonuclease subunit S [Pectobacterium parmentieri]|uniref:restriction endonuclease subunit S n=1 Tax=Pectobacterium parmentieri TaxID=1905730 RepID=UPI000EADD711|nr:restriction endonuclease subunit S [Pectobacterium parmentieri]RKO82014.1 restriction endonuclease subunit S [Pectobacterium parmentieri]
MAKYKAYPEYKDSGVEWLGAIPAHWVCTVLKRLCLLATGLTPPTNNEDNYADEGYPWIRPEDINENGPETQASKYVSDNGWKLLRHVEPNSTIICCIGTIGKCGYVREIVSTNQQITAATFRDSERFNFYLMQSARTQLEELATGNVLKILNSERLGTLNVVKVDGKEANIIAEFLDHETAKIDNLIEKQKQLIELLKEKRQAVISHAVTKGLNPNVPMKDSGVEWLGEVPEHWDVAKLSFKYEVLLGKMLDEKRITGKYPGHYLRNTDVQWGVINTEELPTMDFRTEERERYSIKKDDLIVCEGGEIGRCAIWSNETQCFYQKALHRLRPLNNSGKTQFMFYVLYDAVKQGRFISGAGKATIAHLPAEIFKQYKFVFPPLDEQVEIIKFLDVYSELFDNVEEKAFQQISLLQERRTALISAAVTGKIDVRDWVAPANSEMASIEESPEVNA